MTLKQKIIKELGKEKYEQLDPAIKKDIGDTDKLRKISEKLDISFSAALVKLKYEL